VIKILALITKPSYRITFRITLFANYIEEIMQVEGVYFFIHSFTFGIRNKVKAMQGTKTHRTLMLYSDKLKKNDINPAMKPTITISPLQPII